MCVFRILIFSFSSANFYTNKVMPSIKTKYSFKHAHSLTQSIEFAIYSHLRICKIKMNYSSHVFRTEYNLIYTYIFGIPRLLRISGYYSRCRRRALNVRVFVMCVGVSRSIQSILMWSMSMYILRMEIISWNGWWCLQHEIKIEERNSDVRSLFEIKENILNCWNFL